jgi:formylglycine-generating enzyme required for sulfatase activity
MKLRKNYVERVLRGGCFDFGTGDLRVTRRHTRQAMKLRKNPIVFRVLRGGSVYDYNDPKLLHVSSRRWYEPWSRDWDGGFRFVIRGKK